MNITQCIFLLGMASLLFSSACKKTIEQWKDEVAPTVYDTLTTMSDSRIIKLALMNSGNDNIIGAINDSTKEITVYLPHYSQLLFLQVNLTLPDSAKISPSADELIPVFGDSTFKYTVTGKSGKKTIYTIKPVIQQPTFTLNELSSGTIKTYRLPTTITQIAVTGTNLLPSYAVTSLHLITADSTEIRKLSEWTGSGIINTTRMLFGVTTADTPYIKTDTDYWVEMRSYALKYRMQNPIRFRK